MKKETKNKGKDKKFQYEEMEKVEEFSTGDFLKGVGIGVAIGAIAVLT